MISYLGTVECCLEVVYNSSISDKLIKSVCVVRMCPYIVLLIVKVEFVWILVSLGQREVSVI